MKKISHAFANFQKRLAAAAGRPELGQAGFTLTEMLIVVALIGILMTIVVGNISGKFNKAKVDTTKIKMRQLAVVLDDFKRDCNFYPTTDQGLDALINKPSGGRDCKNYNPEGYLKGKTAPKDGWDNDFTYESDGSKFVLRSLGNDGKEGGDGNDKDISSDELE